MTDAEISVQFQNYTVAQFVFGKSRRLLKMKLSGLRITKVSSAGAHIRGVLKEICSLSTT